MVDAGDEIAGLIETLSAAEERLEQLTGGQVDAVVTRAGRTFMLQRSQELLRRHETIRQAAILDALPACVALIDRIGKITSVNDAWRRFSRTHESIGPGHEVGTNYPDACALTQGDEAALAGAVVAGVRAVLKGESPGYSVEYSRHEAQTERWFLLLVSPFAGKPLSGAVLTHFDITERTEAQHEMQRSSRLLAAVIEGTPDHVFVKDREGRYLLCNTALAQMVGRTADDMIGRTNADLNLVDRALLSQQAAADRAEIDGRVMSLGQALSSEDQFVTAAGPRTFLATKAPYRNELGEVIGVIGISRDITSRKEAEKTLRESQAQLSMASRLALVGSWSVDMPPTKVLWSDALASMHDEAPGFSPTVHAALDYYLPEHRDGITAAFNACASEGLPFNVEYELRTTKGRRIWVRAIGEAVRNDDGAIVRVQGALQDISERKRSEHQTRLLADRLSNILGSITDGFLTLDRTWCFTFVNAEALRMLGRPSDSLIGCDIWQELPQLVGSEFQLGLRRAMLSSTGSSFEAFYAPRNGWLGVNCYPSKTGLSIYFSDITQRRKDQDALRELNVDLEVRVAARTTELSQAREEAEQANRAKSSFLAAMSHEIRTPMNGVVGMIDVLEQSKLKDSQAKIVQTVRQSAYALLGIVDDVLDFSKIEAGRLDIEHEPTSLAAVVGQVGDTLDHLARAKGVELTLSVDPGLPRRVLGDALRLRQVLLNLVGNAIKFSNDPGVAGKVEMRADLVAASGSRCTVEFVVSDNGIGMDQATIARLFTPFMQADDSTTRRFGGSGLGLSISHRLVALMGGTIKVVSMPGAGSSFAVRLGFEEIDAAGDTVVEAHDLHPAALDSMPGGLDQITMPAPLSIGNAKDAGRLILVAEDNEINQEVIRKQLALMGFTADIATTGREALECLRHSSYALLLTDLNMPDMDGYELAAAIRAEPAAARLPIVALTANASKGETRRCREIGIDECLIKPLQLVDLHAMLCRRMPAGAQPLRLRSVKPAPVSIATSEAGSASSAAHASAVDLGVLRALVGSDPAVIVEMLDLFRTSAARCRHDIRLGVSLGECKRVADGAHPLKSAANSIGALRLGAICAEMEGSADAGRKEGLAAQLLRFDIEFAAVDRFLDAN